MLGPQCYTCRKRQVRCDSNTPTCLRCQRDLRDCRGYQRPLKFIVYQTPQNTQLEEPPPVSEPRHVADNRMNYPSSATEPQLDGPSSNGDHLALPKSSPSAGRACEACRRQKKCNEAQTRCSRCIRLKVGYIGSGQRQYKFLSQSTTGGDLKKDGRRSFSPKTKFDVTSALGLSKTPQTTLSSLQGALIKAIRHTTDFRFNLAWTYGDFFQLMPQRIGVNSALDSALETLLSAHSDICLGYRSTQVGTLVLHTRALQSLRQCLNDPCTAHTTETLGAVLVLLTLQGIVGSEGDYWSQHYFGASQILKAQHFRYDPDDAFEVRLLENLRSLVLIEGILSGRLDFTTEEWRRLMTPGLREGTPSEVLIRCVSNIPDLLRRRRLLSNSEGEQDLYVETRQHYDDLKNIANEHRITLEGLRSGSFANAVKGLAEVPLGPIVQRTYGMCLFFAITLNLMLRSFRNQDHDIFVEGEYFAEEITAIAQETLSYRPFGSSHMILCLMAGHAATRDQNKRNLIVHAHKVYAEDFPWAIDHSNENGMHSFNDGLQLPGLEKL